MNWARAVAISLVLVVTLAAGVVAGYAYLRSNEIDQNRHFAEELRDGLVQTCERNGNPLRITLAEILHDEIAQSQTADLEKFFPQIPPAELERLVDEENRKRRIRLREIKPLDCAAQYPSADLGSD
jgi:hypothetical protein